MGFDAAEQRRIFGRFATGVTVVTSRGAGDESLCGLTANALTSLSLDPPLVLVAIDRRSQSHPWLLANQCFAINVLSAEQEAISRRFATPGPKDFSDLALSTAVTGAPVLSDALAWVDCKLTQVVPGGDHDILIGEIVAGDARDGRPLLYYAGKYRQIAD